MQFFMFFILWAVSLKPGIPPSILPVKLIAFNGKSNGTANVLQWQTTAEAGTREYIIESAMHGKDFELTAWISPKGTVHGPAFYKYTDTAAGEKTLYRLRMVAANGKEQLSSIVTIVKHTK